MKLDLSFSQNSQKVDTSFNENKSALSSNFGELTVLHDGQNGATFFPSVSDDGVISWTNDRELPNPDPVNIKGEKGDKGDKGDTGAAGKDGANGKTPVRGTDYWTDTDKTDMLNDVLAALPTWNGGSY